MAHISDEENKVVYVGDLSSTVNEELLYKLFGPPKFGKIEKLILKQSKRPSRTLLFAFITYENHEDAEKVITEMNSYPIDGIPIRVLFSEPNFEQIRSNFNGNITINNLNPLVKQKTLIDIFSKYGDIFSCKIPKGKDGELFGVAYIQYTNQKDAHKAILAMNGKEVKGQIINVKKYDPLDRSPNLHIISGIPLQITTNKDLQTWLKDIFSGNEKDKQTYANLDKTVLLLLPDDPHYRQAFLTFLDSETVKDAMEALKTHGMKCVHVTTSTKIRQMKENSAYWDQIHHKEVSHTIYVKNFPSNYTEKNIERMFWTFPDFQKCDFKETISYKYAFVHFSTRKGAKNAIDNSTLIGFINEKGKENENPPEQLFVSYLIDKGEKNKDKDKVNHQNQLNERQLCKKVISDCGKESAQFHRFSQLSPEQINSLIENDELYLKWIKQDNFIQYSPDENEDESKHDNNEESGEVKKDLKIIKDEKSTDDNNDNSSYEDYVDDDIVDDIADEDLLPIF